MGEHGEPEKYPEVIEIKINVCQCTNIIMFIEKALRMKKKTRKTFTLIR